MNEVVRMSAREAVRRLRAREITPLELIDAAVERIEAVEPQVNALPTLCVERAREQAARVHAQRQRERLGHGAGRVHESQQRPTLPHRAQTPAPAVRPAGLRATRHRFG